MPRFFFHARDDLVCEDREGLCLRDAGAAYNEAIRGIRSMIADEIRRGCLPLNGEIQVVDEFGTWSRTVPFREAVRIDG